MFRKLAANDLCTGSIRDWRLVGWLGTSKGHNHKGIKLKLSTSYTILGELECSIYIGFMFEISWDERHEAVTEPQLQI